MVDAPVSGERVVEQLLDGQQRLTALWRSLNDKYADRTYLIAFADDPDDAQIKLPNVEGHARWDKDGRRYPEWIDKADECWARKLIPIKLLRPDDIFQEIQEWISGSEQESVRPPGFIGFPAFWTDGLTRLLSPGSESSAMFTDLSARSCIDRRRRWKPPVSVYADGRRGLAYSGSASTGGSSARQPNRIV